MTLKCNVYSFGVILSETLSGRRNGGMQGLLSHACGLWESNMIAELLDSTMVPLFESEPELLSELTRCIQIGLLYVQETPCDRPTMSAVVAMLMSTTSQIDRPRRMPSLDCEGFMPSDSSHGPETELLRSTMIDLT
ncbi:hypothetical protein CFC21_026204 [Triticum aestivum]|uniref:Serine-threonine/tyrosine-protein kinase catalytic domain-containing protein n=2 Tax=Triticum aestivum TaxID=4565 RepID=A0A3B6CFI5_WHEAT|nr:hypothetical protein CFC21_026204 [Triticum aestivum]